MYENRKLVRIKSCLLQLKNSNFQPILSFGLPSLRETH